MSDRTADLTDVATIATRLQKTGRAPSARQIARDAALASVIGPAATVDAIAIATRIPDSVQRARAVKRAIRAVREASVILGCDPDCDRCAEARASARDNG